MLAMFKLAFPVLVKVTGIEVEVFTDWLPKVRLGGQRLATPELPTPVPVRGIICGLVGALSVTTTEAVKGVAEAELGVNVTVIVQLAPANTVPPAYGHGLEPLVNVKLFALTPITAIREMVKVAFPVLIRLTD